MEHIFSKKNTIILSSSLYTDVCLNVYLNCSKYDWFKLTIWCYKSGVKRHDWQSGGKWRCLHGYGSDRAFFLHRPFAASFTCHNHRLTALIIWHWPTPSITITITLVLVSGFGYWFWESNCSSVCRPVYVYVVLTNSHYGDLSSLWTRNACLHYVNYYILRMGRLVLGLRDITLCACDHCTLRILNIKKQNK